MEEKPAIQIEVSVSESIPFAPNETFIRQVAAAVLEREGPFDQAEVTIRITDDAEIRELNRTFRDIDGSTDVLSFGTQPDTGDRWLVLPGDMPDQLGDVVINLAAAQRQAARYGHSEAREVAWLIAHGILQLLGYSHEFPAPAQVMRRREEQVLRELGLARPEE